MPKETPRPQPASERREPTQPESKAPLRRKTDEDGEYAREIAHELYNGSKETEEGALVGVGKIDEEVIDPEELAGGSGPKGKARAKAEQARKKR